VWERTGTAEELPWFYLSYAHLWDTRTTDPWVEQFFRDLTQALGGLAAPAGPLPYGFLDVPGENMAQRRHYRTRALANCRALIMLCSPDYFVDFECHGEWSAFRERNGADGAVVQVLWERMWTEGPEGVDLRMKDLVNRFGENGLKSEIAVPGREGVYQSAVAAVAETVRDAAKRADPRTAGPSDPHRSQWWRAEPWPGHPVERTLGIHVLAHRRGDILPPGCNAAQYGEQPEDWQPYGQSGPIAELAVKRASELNWKVTEVVDFEKTVRGTGTAAEDAFAGPQLLILDRWALTTDRLREALREYTRERRRHSMAVMVPWDAAARTTDEDAARLQMLTLDTLDRTLRRPKPDFEPLRRGIPDPAAFVRLLPKAIEQARQGFFSQRR
jgi:FxsC-like protein